MSLRRPAIALIAGAALLTAGCGDSPSASGSGANIVEDSTTSEDTPEAADTGETEDTADAEDTTEADTETEDTTETEADTPSGDLGTRDNPLPIGTTITMGDWELSVTDVNLDAAEEIQAENEFNDPPADGRQFVMWEIEATYTGDDSGEPWLDFSWGVVGSAGNTFDGGGMEDYCGVIPNDIMEAGETFPGGTVTGNVCYSVPSDQVDGSTIRIEESFSFDDTRAFYATS